MYGTATFYEMFKFEPVGTYCINVCSNISCQLVGAWELLEHAEHTLGVKAGGTTDDGMFTLEDVECIAACTEAPALQVNYRYRYRVTHAEFDQLIDDLRAGALADEIPPHGTLARVRQRTPHELGRHRPDRASESRRPMMTDVPAFHVPGLVPTGPKLITTRFDVADGYTYDGYVRTGGYTALRKALTSMTPEQVHDEVKTSEMQGRGGAGFPAGTKWGFLPPGVFPRYVVVNGDESEPGTYKDRLLMELDPHQLIEGIVIACYAIGAAQAFLYVRGEMALAQERIAQALNDAYANGLVGTNILGTDFSVDITLTWGAGAYIVGEETALIESLEGERGMPRLKPPYFPAAKGLYMQPTIVNNVETLANVPWIINESGQAFHDIGAPTSTGMRMFAVSGHVNKPGVFEVPNGVTTFRMLFEAPEYCGGVRDGTQRQGVHPRRRRARSGSSTSTSTCRSTSRPSTRPVRCSAPARSS